MCAPLHPEAQEMTQSSLQRHEERAVQQEPLQCWPLYGDHISFLRCCNGLWLCHNDHDPLCGQIHVPTGQIHVQSQIDREEFHEEEDHEGGGVVDDHEGGGEVSDHVGGGEVDDQIQMG